MQQVQRLFVGLQGDGEIGFAAGTGGDAAVEGHEQAADHRDIQRLDLQDEGVLFLGDFVHAHGGGLHPDQRDVDQVADRGRRVTVAVDEFIQHVGGVFGSLDGRDALVGFDAAWAVGDVGFGDVGVHPQVHKALALVALDGLALGLCDGLPQHLHVQVVADGLHVAVLAVAQQTARAADLQIAHGDAEAGAEGRELPDGGQPFLRDVGEGLVPPEGEVGIGFAAAAAHAAPDLVQLGQTHPVGVFDDEGVAVAHVDAGLDEGGADEDIDLAVEQVLPDGVQLLLGHLAVGDADAGTGHHLADVGGGGLDVVHPVVQVVDLPAARKLFLHGFGQDDVVVFEDEGLHGLALDGRLLDGGQVPDAAHGHVQGAGDGGGRQGQHVHPDEVLLELFLVLDAEPLLLVDDDKAQVVEADVFGQQAVGAHHDVHAACLQAAQGLLLLLGGAEAGEHPDLDRERLHAGEDRVVVLPGQQGGGGQDGALFAAHDALERGPQGHFGLADAHVAAEQAVHRVAALHVLFDLGGGVELVVGLIVLEAGLKIALPVAVRREGIAGGLPPPGIQLDQLLRHLLGGLFDFGAGALPLGAAELGQLDLFLVAGGGVTAQQVQLGDGHIQHIRAGILDLQIILDGTLHFQPLDARIHADAVALVDHIVAGFDVRQAGQGILVLFAFFGLGGFVQTMPPGRDDRHPGERKGAPGGQVAGQHLHQPFGGADVPAHADGVALVGQIAGQGRRALGCTGKEGDGVALGDERVEVLSQGGQVAAPVGGRKGLCVDEVFQLELVHPAQEVLTQQGALFLRRENEVVHGLVQHIQAGAEHALFEQAGQLFTAPELGGLLGVPNAAHLVQHEERRIEVVQQGGWGGIPQAVVFVHGFGHQAGVQLRQVGLHGLFQRRAVLAARLFLGRAQGLGGVGGAAEQHFAGGGEIDLFQRAVPPLGQQVKGGQRVDLVVPVFDAGRLVHVGRIDVHDVAAHTELAGAVHLAAADIAGREEPLHQRLAVVDHAGLEGEGVLLELRAGDGVLQQGLCRDADGVQPPAGQCTQHRQPPVLVLTAGTLHRAEHKVAGREDRRRQAQRLEVVGEVGGLGLAGRHDAEHPAQVFLQGCVQQGAACRGQAEQRRRAGRGKARRNLLVLCRMLQQGFVHRGPPLVYSIRLPVVAALCQPKLAVHDEPGGRFQIGVAVGHGLDVVGRELAQHPVGQIVVGAGLGTHTDADAGKVLAAQPGDDALQAVVAACRAGGPDAQLAGGLGDVVAQDDDVVGRDLEEAGQRGDGVARKVHVGQGLEQHDLVAVHLALAPQALEFGFADRDAPFARQMVQRGKTGIVAGAVVLGLRVAQTGDQPDVICIHR